MGNKELVKDMDFLVRYLKPLLPPLILDLVNSFRNRTFVGSYATWEDALKDSSCDYSRLLEDVKNSLLDVKNGKAEFVVDSVSLQEPQYNWPLLAMLLKAAGCRDGSLAVLDFGGALGTVYFQNRKFLAHLKEVRWCVVEQPTFAEVGRDLFQDRELSFHVDIAECIRSVSIDLILVSGVLQLLEDPYETLNTLLRESVRFVVIDRTPFIAGADLLTVQKLPKHMHNASFPHWFLNQKRLLDLFSSHGYRLVSRYEAYKCLPAYIAGSSYSGLIFEKIGRAEPGA